MPTDIERRKAIVNTATFKDSGSAKLFLKVTLGPGDQVYVNSSEGGTEPMIAADDMEAAAQIILMLRSFRAKQKRHAAKVAA